MIKFPFQGMNEDDIEVLLKAWNLSLTSLTFQDLRFRERLTRAANLFDLSVAIHGYGDSEFALQGSSGYSTASGANDFMKQV